MKRKILSVALLIVLLLCLVGCEHSTRFTENGLRYWEWQGELIVLGFDGDGSDVTDLVIKGNVEHDSRYYTWCVQVAAFENSNLESVTIEYYKAESNPFYSGGEGFLTFDEIRERAFKGCKNLTRVSLPYGMTTIGEQAFYNCGKLESISFPFRLQTVGNEAFANCTSLKEVHIDENLQSLGSGAFFNCADSITVYLKCAPPQTDGEVFSPEATVKLVVPENLVFQYQSDEFWSRYQCESL